MFTGLADSTVTSHSQTSVSHYRSTIEAFSTQSTFRIQKIMESQDEQNSMCSSSNIVPIENESEMPSQANETTDEVIETKDGRFTSKAWKYLKPLKVDGVRFSVYKYCGACIKSTRNCRTSSMVDHIRRCRKNPSNLEIEGGSRRDDGSRPYYFDKDVCFT
ncbi:hypothetical protein HAX54_036342 [Datura stramonium]|uniref:BED-type domain-containing protein n=1 Tax=Datura stramonium TaxID=4076 RepID=A0ABS8SG48_DATST|nr:hypothetical protein [Datura stramonium]